MKRWNDSLNHFKYLKQKVSFLYIFLLIIQQSFFTIYLIKEFSDPFLFQNTVHLILPFSFK